MGFFFRGNEAHPAVPRFPLLQNIASLCWRGFIEIVLRGHLIIRPALWGNRETWHWVRVAPEIPMKWDGSSKSHGNFFGAKMRRFREVVSHTF